MRIMQFFEHLIKAGLSTQLWEIAAVLVEHDQGLTPADIAELVYSNEYENPREDTRALRAVRTNISRLRRRLNQRESKLDVYYDFNVRRYRLDWRRLPSTDPVR